MHMKQLSHCLAWKEVANNTSIIILVANSSYILVYTEQLTPDKGKIKKEMLFMQKPL